jgi:hypothetical protein
MFWFISPWEAARRSLEAQRRVMALPWLFFASERSQEELAEGRQARSEPPVPARSMTARPPKAIPARRTMETVKEPLGARRGKHKSSRRKNKMIRKK